MKTSKITRKVRVTLDEETNSKSRGGKKKIKIVEEEREEVSQEDVDSDDVSENHESDESDDATSEKEEKKPSKRKRRRPRYNAAEEARLSTLVFGDPSDVINNLLEHKQLSSDDDEDDRLNLDDEEANFMKHSDDSDSDNDDAINSVNDEDDDASGNRNVAWVDDDDMEYSVDAAAKAQNRKLRREIPEKKYTELLENKFSKIVGTPKWASLDSAVKNDDEDSDNEILKHSNHLAIQKVTKLRKGKIDIKALTDINKSTHTEGSIVTSVEFHPTSTVALVAGISGILSLFQIDGRENNKLHSIKFDKFRIDSAKFVKEGTEVILGSRNHSHCQAYDLMSGKTYRIPLPHGITNMKNFEISPDGKLIAIAGRMGQIHLLSAVSKELVANLKMNKKCHALAFSPDSRKLITHGASEEMYIWDVNSRSCLNKAIDDGCMASEALAYSPSGQFIATGSKQGVVNIYEAENVIRTRTPIPLKIILNLTTSITKLKFNPTSEILAMASNLNKNAFKMVHIPSFTVFANFPTFQTKMYNPGEIDFSPGGGYLGLSNNRGHAYLYRLKHYGNY